MSYEATIRSDVSHALFDLKGEKQALIEWVPGLAHLFPDHPNTCTAQGQRLLYWIGPEHWIFRGPLSDEVDIRDFLRIASAPQNISLVLISDTLSFFAIDGPDAAEIMAIASPLDTHSTAFPLNSATYTEAFGLKALIARMQSGYELAVDRSFAAMMEDCLTRAVRN